jgi:hypothetical protein
LFSRICRIEFKHLEVMRHHDASMMALPNVAASRPSHVSRDTAFGFIALIGKKRHIDSPKPFSISARPSYSKVSLNVKQSIARAESHIPDTGMPLLNPSRYHCALMLRP